MECYPAELVTPPLALVALLGSPELHAPVGEFLRSHHKPPINSVGVADPLAVGRIFGALGSLQQLRLLNYSYHIAILCWTFSDDCEPWRDNCAQHYFLSLKMPESWYAGERKSSLIASSTPAGILKVSPISQLLRGPTEVYLSIVLGRALPAPTDCKMQYRRGHKPQSRAGDALDCRTCNLSSS